MIRNLIFDLGGVLVRWEPAEFIRHALGNNPRAEAVCRAVFESTIWPEVDRGTISEAEGAEDVLRRHPEMAEEIATLFSGYKKYLVPLEENVALLKEMKNRGYRLYLLSNVGEAVWSFVTERDPHLELFDGRILSYQEGTIKPEKEIYQRLLDRYELEPEESLFIDDRAENIAAAGALKIRGLLLPCNSPAVDLLEPLLTETP